MKDSTEARRCEDCGTEFHLHYYCKPNHCRACAITHDDYTPEIDGEPCADCDRPVWYCDDEGQWFHTDPSHACFLAQGKEKRDESA